MINIKRISTYNNGNYTVTIFDDGTKVRYKENDLELRPSFPENIDMKISNKCNVGCKFCHENSTPSGKIADIKEYIPFLDTLRPYTELALGGGALSEIPGEDFIFMMDYFYYRNLLVNVTINQNELKNSEFLDNLEFSIKSEFIKGVGISYTGKDPLFESFVRKYRKNVVVHIINGIVSEDDLNYLSGLKCKILILGYKEFGRGLLYSKKFKESIENNKKYLESVILELPKKFKTVSFDCLAVSQLNLKDKVSPGRWKKLYMGDDGKFTMYVDLVSGTYAASSTSAHSKRYKLNKNDKINDIFKVVRGEN